MKVTSECAVILISRELSLGGETGALGRKIIKQHSWDILAEP